MIELGYELILLFVVALIIVVICKVPSFGKKTNNKINGAKKDMNETELTSVNSNDKKRSKRSTEKTDD